MKTRITEHGAVGDGVKLNTAAIQKAVNTCASSGGGCVVVPVGIFVTGAVELKSNITLLLEPGAILRGSESLEDYPPHGFHHNEFGETRSFLYAIDRQNIRITGDGVIELVDRPFMLWDQIQSGLPAEREAELDQRQRSECVLRNLARPNQPIFFHNCRQLRMDGIQIRNSPCWTITFSACRDILVDRIVIKNHLQVPNNDGIHFSACKDIIVTNCLFSCGDDCLAFTGITSWDEPCERIVIANCTMTSHSCAVRFGHLASKVRDVVVSNLVITDSNRGFAIQAGDKGWVENIIVSNIVMDTRMIAGGWWGKGEPLLISAFHTSSGRIERITFNNIRSQSDNSVVIVGQNGNVRHVTLKDWDLSLRYGKNRPLYGQFVDLQPAPTLPALDPEKHIPWLFADGADNLNFENIRFRRQEGEKHSFSVDPCINQEIRKTSDPPS